jgi:putative salt-induced outer membrane protein YdiY
LSKNEFRHETRAGAIFTTGNTESLSATGNSFTLYRVKRFENKWRLGFYFNRVDENVANPGVVGTIANYIYGFYRLDYYFLPRTTCFVGGGGYSDEIKGIDVAANAFAGVSHYWLRSPTYSLNTALGYDFTHEDRLAPAPSVDIHAILFSLNYQQQFKSYLGFSQGVVLLENGGNGRDLRVNSDTELKVVLTNHFGLIFGFHLRFDNVPVPGFKKLDTISDVSLAVTFGGNVAKPCP